ncbi:MAG: TonB-dependent receptor [Saprospiraceae bacterium]|nr:TonB-dependent receptor [Candidatus Vicinibacter affinis]
MKKILCLLWLFSFDSNAQSFLSGRVLDENSDPYQQVLVKIEQLNNSTWTDSKGYYEFRNLPSGTYAVSVDYGYDIEYRQVLIEKSIVTYDFNISRRINFEEINISSTKWGSDGLVSTKKITGEEILKNRDDKDLPYMLNNLPSIQVQSDAGNGIGYAGFRVRGIDPNQIQVNLNGIPLNDAESSRTYFVNTPDLLSSIDRMEVLTGFVPGRSGPGGFGASLDLNLNKLYFKPFARIATQFGSYNSSMFSVMANTGLFEDAYNLEIRYSRQNSNGFIERSDSRLRSLFLSGAVIKKKYSLRLNFIQGSELTGQAWNGLPYQYFNTDSLYTWNLSGREKSPVPYDNEVDNYKQTHSQIFYNKSFNRSTNLVFNFNFTKGRGFYENFKSNNNLADYGLTHPDTMQADLIRRKWLDNDFLYSYLGLEKVWNSRFSSSFGIAYSFYKGKHFGQIISTSLYKVGGLGLNYYFNTGKKNEMSYFFKSSYGISSKVKAVFDFHLRSVNYNAMGTDDSYGAINITQQINLANPKLAFIYILSDKIQASFSSAYYEREPYREELLSNPTLGKEKLVCLDAGFIWSIAKFKAAANLYHMEYRDYLAPNGDLNDTGDPLRVNIPKAFRSGVECNVDFLPVRFIGISYQVNISKNRARNFNEKIPVFDGNYTQVGEIIRFSASTPLAFSPSQIHGVTIKFNLLERPKRSELLQILFNTKFVGAQYLDLSGKNEAMIEAYHVEMLKLQYGRMIKKANLNAYIQVNNLTNQRYTSHGWFSRFGSTTSLDPNTDPYLGTEDQNIYYYKGLFPQALRHFSLGINLTF